MKMLLDWLVVILVLIITPKSIANDEREALIKAGQEGAEAQITFQVVDEKNQPVENVHVKAGFYQPWKEYKKEGDWSSQGKTDANGIYIAVGRSAVDMTFTMTKEGYYVTGGAYMLGQSKPKIIDGRWQPWNPTFKVLLREKKNPVAMYLKRVDTKVPVQEKPVGYDLIKGDWVTPYGKGEIADFLITVKGRFVAIKDLDFSMTITFSNQGDGIQFFGEFPYEGYIGESDFISPYLAPEEGYLSSWNYDSAKIPPEEWHHYPRKSKHREIHFFRVRTELDSRGQVVKALYGKIHGEIVVGFEELKPGGAIGISFTYYLNPDGTRNMEHIPGRTLFKEPWVPSPKK